MDHLWQCFEQQHNVTGVFETYFSIQWQDLWCKGTSHSVSKLIHLSRDILTMYQLSCTYYQPGDASLNINAQQTKTFRSHWTRGWSSSWLWLQVGLVWAICVKVWLFLHLISNWQRLMIMLLWLGTFICKMQATLCRPPKARGCKGCSSTSSRYGCTLVIYIRNDFMSWVKMHSMWFLLNYKHA